MVHIFHDSLPSHTSADMLPAPTEALILAPFTAEPCIGCTRILQPASILKEAEYAPEVTVHASGTTGCIEVTFTGKLEMTTLWMLAGTVTWGEGRRGIRCEVCATSVRCKSQRTRGGVAVLARP